MRFFAVTVLAWLSSGIVPADGQVQKISLADAAAHAVVQSKLTEPGSTSFHLKAKIVETTNPDSSYRAEVEEHWLAPEKWRRTIQSPGFSQVVVVNGAKAFEKNDGDYYPWWLSDLVKAIFDLLPMADQLKQVNAQIAKPAGSEHSTTCALCSRRRGISYSALRAAKACSITWLHPATTRPLRTTRNSRASKSPVKL